MKRILIGVVSGLVALLSTNSWGASGDQPVNINSANVGATVTVTVAEVGTNIRKAFAFSDVPTGIWVEIGSYTVTAGKSLKIYNAHATGRYALDFKISDGVAGQELYLATSLLYAADELNITRPVVIPAGTVVRVYVRPDCSINSGTIAFGGFEY